MILPCSVINIKPILGFDLRYHSGYEVSVPLQGTRRFGKHAYDPVSGFLASNRPALPVYFIHRMRVPAIEDEAKGDAYFQGSFDIGEGKYKVEWLMRDRTERVCSSFWEVESSLPLKDKQVALSPRQAAIQPSEREQFRDEPPIQRVARKRPLNVKVLVNFAPQNSRVGYFAASRHQRAHSNPTKHLPRSPDRQVHRGGFQSPGAPRRLPAGQCRKDRLPCPRRGARFDQPGNDRPEAARPEARETEFLTKLIQEEVGASATPDAVVFAGPKALLEESVPQESLRQIGELGYPVFYMNYNLYPQAVPWNDAIRKAVKFLKGYEYTISKPRDLWFAVTEMVSRIVKTKQGRRSGTSSSE